MERLAKIDKAIKKAKLSISVNKNEISTNEGNEFAVKHFEKGIEEWGLILEALEFLKKRYVEIVNREED